MRIYKHSRRKNVSQKIKNGTTILTRDEFFEDHNNYRKEEYVNRPDVFYRSATVLDSNRNNELALVKQQSNGKFSVKKKNGKVSYYNTYIKTKDDEGKPIKLGTKFKRANPKYDVSTQKANTMKKHCVKSPNKKIAYENRILLKELKGRKK